MKWLSLLQQKMQKVQGKRMTCEIPSIKHTTRQSMETANDKGKKNTATNNSNASQYRHFYQQVQEDQMSREQLCFKADPRLQHHRGPHRQLQVHQQNQARWVFGSYLQKGEQGGRPAKM